jgi:hypothetical protein
MTKHDDDCTERTQDGRQCLLAKGHSRLHRFHGIEGENCTCILRWYPNRCTAHPECNQ